MVKKIQYSLLLTGFALLMFSFYPFGKGAPNSIKTIVIDAGHGGKDPGCHGVTHKEKDIALAVALKLGKLLEAQYPDVKIIYTRQTDVFVELEERAQIANRAKADLFISIHCNAAGKAVIIKDPKTGKKRKKLYKNKKGKLVPVETINPVPFGSETYVMAQKNEEGKMKVATRENSAIFLEDDYEKKYGGFDPESIESYIIMSNYSSAYVLQSASLAKKIQDEYKNKAGRIDKGVHRQSIWVLWRTSMPSILTEIGYLTNPLEETFLGSETGQDYLAKAIFRGVRKYKDEVEGSKREYNDEYENQTPLENENVKAGNLPDQKPEEEEEDETIENKGPAKPDLSVKTSSGTVTEKTPVKNDSIKTESAETTDTLLNAKKIAEKYREEKNKNNGKAPGEKQDIVFAVQFTSSPNPLDLKVTKYAQIDEASFYKYKGEFKYISGGFSSFGAAVARQNALRKKGFGDCFVVALKNGQRIDLNQAKKLLGQ